MGKFHNHAAVASLRNSGAHIVTVLGAALVLPAAAQAQDQGAGDQGLSEIVVTAQRRAENLQDVPISVTAITAESLASSGITSTLQIDQIVPSVAMTKSGPSAIFFIRGVGNTSGGTGEEGANAFYIDGVYLADLAQANADFNNIERIEVLKGPQGTLFGRNSSGGLVNVITKDPGDHFEAKGSVGVANYQSYKGQLYVSGPITSTLSANIALTGRDQKDGWGKNIFDGRDARKGWFWGARTKALWKPVDTVKLTLAGDYWHSKDDFWTAYAIPKGAVSAGGYTTPGYHNRNSSQNDDTDLRVWGLSATGEVDLDFATLTSITAYRELKSQANIDADYQPTVAIELYIPSFSKTFQQEIRLASNGSGPFSWQLGGFFFHARAGIDNQRLVTGGGANNTFLTSAMTTHSYAGFAEATYDITPTTHLTGGFRYTSEDRGIRYSGFTTVNGVVNPAANIPLSETSRSYNKITYRASIREDLTPDINVYASFNRGFKSGLFAVQSPAAPPVRPQTTDAFEIGFKSELFDRLVRFNGAYYHYDISDYQVRAAPISGANPILLNATKVKVDGFEGEIQVAPAKGLLLSGHVNILNSRFGKFLNAPFTYPNPSVCNVPAGTGGRVTGSPVPINSNGIPVVGGARACLGDASGFQTPLAPKFTVSAGISYTLPINGDDELSFNALFSHNSGYFFEQDNRLRQASFQLLNGSIEYKFTRNWSLELWANNLTNTRYYVAKLGSAISDKGELQAPRTFGANVKFNY